MLQAYQPFTNPFNPMMFSGYGAPRAAGLSYGDGLVGSAPNLSAPTRQQMWGAASPDLQTSGSPLFPGSDIMGMSYGPMFGLLSTLANCLFLSFLGSLFAMMPPEEMQALMGGLFGGQQPPAQPTAPPPSAPPADPQPSPEPSKPQGSPPPPVDPQPLPEPSKPQGSPPPVDPPPAPEPSKPQGSPPPANPQPLPEPSKPQPPAPQPLPGDPARPADPAPGAATRTLPDGLEVRDDQVGTGAAPKPGDMVYVRFTGKLPDGTEFDGSDKHNGALFHFPFGQGKVIKGWDEGMEGMQEGGKRHLKIPAALAYGDKQMGPIPPNTPLDFDVELVKVVPPPPPPQPVSPPDNPTAPVVTLPDGLKERDDVVGTGDDGPKPGDVVWVRYTGRLPDGTEFDGSDKHGGSLFHFTLGKGQVIKGWDEGLVGMKAGGQRHLEIPADLAYGDKQVGPIKPNSQLNFDVQLVKFATPPPPPPPAPTTPVPDPKAS